jgi:hypothetical protein
MSVKHNGELLKDNQKEGKILDDKKKGEMLKNNVPEGKKLWIDDTLNENENEKKELNEFTLS